MGPLTFASFDAAYAMIGTAPAVGLVVGVVVALFNSWGV